MGWRPDPTPRVAPLFLALDGFGERLTDSEPE